MRRLRRRLGLAALVLGAFAACVSPGTPAAPMVPANEPMPGHADAGDARGDAADASDASDAAEDDVDGTDGDRAACANAAHALKMPSMRECVAKCGELPARPPRGCLTRETCKHRCYATFGPM